MQFPSILYPFLQSLLIDGIIGGVGAVVGFLPFAIFCGMASAFNGKLKKILIVINNCLLLYIKFKTNISDRRKGELRDKNINNKKRGPLPASLFY